MPAYTRWGHAQSRLPLTPPEYQPTYLNSLSAVSDDMHNFYGSQNCAPRGTQSSREYNRYHHNSTYFTQPAVSLQNHNRKQISDFHMGYPPQMIPPYQYGPVAAPLLPPIHVPGEVSHFVPHYSHAHPEQKPKEEKPTGGVAQHLDYEMDLMSAFVAEMSQRIVSQGSSPTSQFRKYVSQILSSTRLPSSTIMLGLFYLQERMKILAQRGYESSSSGTVYRMLTTCLLLGSKFLDDNTFQNRSWAEVSSIPVGELNTMELEWLKDFNWEIHGLMYKDEEGFFQWVNHWHMYEEKAQVAKVKEIQKLAPIETNLSRNHASPQPLMSPEGPIPVQYQHGPQYDTQWVRPYISDYSPPSAPDSGPTTPEYYANGWTYPQAPQSYARASWNAKYAPAYTSQRSQVPPYQTAYHGQGYSHSGWAGHGPNCGCNLCAKHSDYYFSQSGYGMQSVMG